MSEEQLILLLLMEECSEVQKIVSKMIRFGVYDWHPKTGSIPNSTLLKEELNDIYAILEILSDKFGIDVSKDSAMISLKKTKIEKYKQYSIDLGRVKIIENE